MSPRRSMSPRRKITAFAVAAVCLAAVIVGLVVFKPWLLWVDVEVSDALPQVSAPAAPTASSSTSGPGSSDTSPSPAASATSEAPTSAPAPDSPTLISEGTFVSHEHETTGTAQVIEEADGSRVLALSGLSTSSGPDVHVWLSAGPVIEGNEGWYTAGQYDFVDLGPIKGNLGDQVYAIPDDVDLGSFPSVDLWCVEFGVSFGAAELS